MASFAVLVNGTVVEVVKVDNSVMVGPDGKEDEALGKAFLAEQYGTNPDAYVQTWYPVDQPEPYPRGKYAAIGDLWNGTNFVSASDEPSD